VSEDDQAADVARLFSPQRLRLARETRSLTQTELSARLGTSSAAVSQFEKADARPTAATVTRLAGALAFPVEFFATGSSPSSRPDGGIDRLDGYGHFRSLRSLTAKQRQEALSVTPLVRDLVDALSRHVRLPDPAAPWVPADSDEPALAEGCAAMVRRAWSMPPGPIGDVIQLAERHGIVVARHRIATAAVSAFSAPFPERPVIVLHQHGAKRDRDRFSVSHEIGHLTMHQADNILVPKATELQAHRFASAFLMPAEEIRDELPSKTDWVYLLALKQRWQVSIGALLRRANDLAVMNDSTYAQAMRTVSTRGWRTVEPGDLGVPEAPTLLARAVEIAKVDSVILATETGWPIALINDVISASTDVRPSLDI
jgi:Zn-dependent peptidase ImmA (M78 family)/transcriptional regulator with XRE-family HTH domain